MSFFSMLLSKEFEEAKVFVNKASYSAVSFLEKTSEEFKSVQLSVIDSCEINDNKAKCLCEFSYFGGEKFEQEVLLEKYDEEWLIDFQLGITFKDIFHYNYGRKTNVKWEDVEQQPLDSLARHGVVDILETLVSGEVKIGFSDANLISEVDQNYEGNANYGSSETIVGDLFITTNYSFYDDRLESCYVEIVSATADPAVCVYAKGIAQVIVESLGRPFNVPENEVDELRKIVESRWFIKGYNELLTVKFDQSYISLSISEIP